MAINLYAVRLVLNGLGAADYGIYTVVAGIITMLSCVTSVLITATQRYFSYALGEKATESLCKIFSVSVYVSIIVSILILIIGETLGLWFVNNKLVVPEERVIAANILYQATIISFISTFLQMPYGSAIVAHEKMGYFALITTIESILKFGAALVITADVNGDKLIIYGILLSVISILVLCMYIIVARTKFEECRYRNIHDKKLIKELLSFSGWNFIGSIAGVGMHYVNTILVNIFFGPLINAAQAIAFQISSALNTFSGSFIMALKPPMIKSYAEKDYKGLNQLFGIGNKFVYYCMLVVSIPLISEMDTVIKIWLGISDAQTILFSRLIVLYTFILVLNNPISIIIQATGYVKQYFLSVESVTLLCPIISFLLFKFGMPAYTSFIAMIGCVLCSHFIRLIVLKRYYAGFNLHEYLDFLCRAISVTICTTLPVFIVRMVMCPGFVRLLMVIAIVAIVTILSAYFIGLNHAERAYMQRNFLSRVFRKRRWNSSI